MPLPTICAIIPLYNGERFIEAALRSVLNQSLPATQIFVVDDGSTDGGAAKAREVAADDPRVQVINKQNGGQSSARNLAVLSSNSEYVAFLDQDDEWYPRHLEILYQPFLRDLDGLLGFTYGNLDEVDALGRMVNVGFLNLLESKHPKLSIFDCLRQDMYVLPGASLIRQDVFTGLGGFDETLIGYEDDDLFLRAFETGWSNVYLNTSVTRWRIHGASTSYTRKMQISRMIYARKLMEKYPDDPSLRRYFIRDYIAPRFIHVAKAEYLGALHGGQRELAVELAKDLSELAPHAPDRERRRLQVLIWFSRAQWLFGPAMGVRRLLPRGRPVTATA